MAKFSSKNSTDRAPSSRKAPVENGSSKTGNKSGGKRGNAPSKGKKK